MAKWVAAPFSLFLILAACAHHPVPVVLSHAAARGTEALATMKSLRTTVDAVVGGGGNLGRFRALRARADEMGLGALARVEPIDWWTFQKNLLIEIPGPSGRIIYITAHYDRTDASPLKLVSLFLNGLPDEALGWSYLSDGATDNATGVAVALELAHHLASSKPRDTYRVLLTGAEESGLRGSRAHVSRLSDDERGRLAFAVNIDTVGLASSANCVTENVSNSDLLAAARAAAKSLGYPLEDDQLPFGAYGDFAPFRRTSFGRDVAYGLLFNMPGGLLPQRSWFTGPLSAPVINFSACGLVGPSDYLASATLLPVGQLHGPRDRASGVDLERLFEQYAIIRKLLGSDPLQAVD